VDYCKETGQNTSVATVQSFTWT